MLCGHLNSRTGTLLDYVFDNGDERLENNLKVTTQIVSNRKVLIQKLTIMGKKLIN